ncbi:DUF134 domain-containing protein [archaeon]|nr:MAG: DUF134 domain-containing protein [archaeon]
MPFGRGRRRGRGRRPRHIAAIPRHRRFGPSDRQLPSALTIRLEELEAMRLVDHEGLTQEDAAEAMGVSRKTLWVDLQEARRKVIESIYHGRGLEIVDDADMVIDE